MATQSTNGSPVTGAELEALSLRVAQVRSTVNVLVQSWDSVHSDSDIHNTLGLLVLELDHCSEDLGDLANRFDRHQEVRT